MDGGVLWRPRLRGYHAAMSDKTPLPPAQYASLLARYRLCGGVFGGAPVLLIGFLFQRELERELDVLAPIGLVAVTVAVLILGVKFAQNTFRASHQVIETADSPTR